MREKATLALQEEHILRCLGAAVVLRWDQWPHDIQREVFDVAGSVGPLADATELRGRIARFLHTYGHQTGSGLGSGPQNEVRAELPHTAGSSSIHLAPDRAQSPTSLGALDRWDDEGGAPQRITVQ